METRAEVVRVTVASCCAAGCLPEARQRRDTASIPQGTSTLKVRPMLRILLALGLQLAPPSISMPLLWLRSTFWPLCSYVVELRGWMLAVRLQDVAGVPIQVEPAATFCG